MFDFGTCHFDWKNNIFKPSFNQHKKLTEGVEEALSSGGVGAAKELCRNTKGPVASIFYQGLDRADESIESAEKAVIAYGGVQMGQLEKMFLGFLCLLL